MTSKSTEEYLKTIYTLNEEGKQAGTSEIASRLGVRPSSVTGMLKKLADQGYIQYESYKGATLTDRGSKIASKVVRKHRLLERFLTDILKIRKNHVHQQACEMEHTLSDEAEEALCRVLEHPDFCPNDEKPIPPCTKNVPSCTVCSETPIESEREKAIIPLSTLKVGESGVVTFVRGGRRAVQRLTDMGLTKDTTVEVLNSAPFHGPVEISVRGTKLAIGRGLASRIFVEVK